MPRRNPADGRYVSFASDAANLVPGDTNGKSDVFVRDLQTRATERVSIDSAGLQSDGFSGQCAMTSDARYVAFDSSATNLASGQVAPLFDVSENDSFIHDRATGATDL